MYVELMIILHKKEAYAMLESYCGKSCELCPRHGSKCPGCKELPENERCKIAECCCKAGHDNCSECAFSANCSKLADRQETRPHRFKFDMTGVQVDERVRANAAQTAKRLKILFWLNIANLVISFISNQDKSGTLLWLSVTTMVLSAGVTIAYVLTLLKLANMSRQYRWAGILYFVSFALVVIVSIAVLINPTDSAYYALPLLAGIAADVLTAVFEYTGHAELLSTVDVRLSRRWQLLWKWNLILIIAIAAAFLLAFISLFMMLFVVLVAALGLLAVTIISLVSLWQSAQAIQSLVPPGEAEAA